MNIYVGDIHSITSPPAKLHYVLVVYMELGGRLANKKSYDRPPDYWKGISNTVDGWSK